MKSNIRVIRILQYLVNNSRTTIREIESDLGISEEVIRYELENLNDYLDILKLSKIQKKSNGNIYANIENVDKVIESVMAIYKMSGEERREYLAFKFINEKKINITHEMNNLSVARNTIKSDLKCIVEEFKAYGIEVKNWQISGGFESSFRNYLFNKYVNHHLILFEESNEPILISEVSKAISKTFKGYNINKIIDFVKKSIYETNNYQLYDTFLLYIIIMVERILQGYTLEETEEFKNYCGVYSNEILNNLNEIKTEFKIEINDVEFSKLVEVLTGLNNNGFNTLYEENIVRANLFVTNLIEHVGVNMGINFKEDEILLEGLFEHTKATMYRLKHGFKNQFETYYLAIEQHVNLYNIVKEGLRELEKMMCATLSKEEIALYVVHFLGAQRRIEETQTTIKRVVLICNSGYGTSILLRNILEANYYIEVVESISLYQLNNFNYENIDVAISTLDLDYELKKTMKVSVLYISPFLNFEDAKTLKKYGIERKRNSTIPSVSKILEVVHESAVVINKEKLQNDLKDLLSNKFVVTTQSASLFDEISENDIYIVDKEISWEAMLEIGGRHLINKGVVEESYVEEVFQSINSYGPHFILKNKIAIPHAGIDSGVNNSGITIVYSKEDVIFGNGLSVRLLIFIASPDKPRLLSTVMKTKELTEDAELYTIIQNASKKEIKNYLLK